MARDVGRLALVKPVTYRGGLIRFQIPAHWTEGRVCGLATMASLDARARSIASVPPIRLSMIARKLDGPFPKRGFVGGRLTAPSRSRLRYAARAPFPRLHALQSVLRFSIPSPPPRHTGTM